MNDPSHLLSALKSFLLDYPWLKTGLRAVKHRMAKFEAHLEPDFISRYCSWAESGSILTYGKYAAFLRGSPPKPHANSCKTHSAVC